MRAVVLPSGKFFDLDEATKFDQAKDYHEGVFDLAGTFHPNAVREELYETKNKRYVIRRQGVNANGNEWMEIGKPEAHAWLARHGYVFDRKVLQEI